MEKIILTEKTVGNIVGRLKKIMENHVFTSQLMYNISPSKARHPIQYNKERAGKDYSIRSYYMNAKVSRHSFSKGKRMTSLGDMAMPYILINFHQDAGTCFSEGDVFYFHGSMILIDMKTDLRLQGQSFMGRMSRVVEKLQLITSPDEKLINNIKGHYEMEEAYAKDYWKGVKEEQEKEMDSNLQKL